MLTGMLHGLHCAFAVNVGQIEDTIHHDYLQTLGKGSLADTTTIRLSREM